jgi:hypothetical protein
MEPHRLVGPDGKAAYSMNCSGAGRTMDACYQQADALCPAGYDIVESASGLTGVPLMNGGTQTATTRSIVIACK